MRRSMFWGVLVLLLYFAGSASAAPVSNDTDDSNVTVTISTVTQINVDPSDLTWTVAPGGECGGGGSCNESLSNFYALQIENTGSKNITKIWFNNTYPTDNPFGAGLPSSYDSGNFVVLGNESASGAEDYFFINRVDYNETKQLVYLTDPNGLLPPASDWMYGRFRNASYEYFWMINKSDSCNRTKNLYIGNLAHTASSSGTVNFNTGDVETVVLTAGASDMYGVGDIDSGNLSGYCVLVNASCNQVYLYKLNMDMQGAGTDCDNALYVSGDVDDSAWINGQLPPGGSRIIKIKVRVPYGVYEGETTSGTITVMVSDVVD
ncbi:MAG: hypothetical protein ABH851_02115 [Methanobacteriota archaeon]